ASRIGLGVVILVVVAQLSPVTLLRWAMPLYIFTLLMLIVVEVMGDLGMGARRWLVIPGVVRFQPSELMKLAMPMMLAAYLCRRELPPRWPELLVCALIMAVPVLLIARQPDLGTSLLVTCAAVFVILLAGLSWRF